MALLRRLGGLDHLPKLGILLQGFVLLHLQARAIHEILERVPAQDAMHQHPEFVSLKINPEVPDAKTMQDASAAFQLAEVVEFRADDLLRQAAKLTEDLQLEFLRHPRHFGGAGRREDDLKRTHTFDAPILASQPPKTTLCLALRSADGPRPQRVNERSAFG